MQNRAIQIEYWDIDRIIPYAGNPRYNDHAVERMSAVIAEYGFLVPALVESSGQIVDGHLRYKAAKRLEMTTIPVIVSSYLTEAQIKAFRISVNTAATWADWDYDKLRAEMADLKEYDYDIRLTGMDMREISKIMDGISISFDSMDDEAESGKDGADKTSCDDETQCPKCGCRFSARRKK